MIIRTIVAAAASAADGEAVNKTSLLATWTHVHVASCEVVKRHYSKNWEEKTAIHCNGVCFVIVVKQRREQLVV